MPIKYFEYKNKIAWLISLMGHCILIYLFCWFPYKNILPVAIGDEQEIINTFVTEGAVSSQLSQPVIEKMADSKQTIQKEGLNLSKAVMTTKKKLLQKPLQKNVKTTQPGSHSKGQRTEMLLVLLHAQIQERQRYPQMAQELEQQGRVTVQFILLPHGQVQAISIAKSSGFSNLDQAALAAVANAAPFKDVDKFIQTSGFYKVDVVFELA